MAMLSPLTLAIAAMALMGAADAVSRRARQMDAPASTYLFAQSPFFVVTAIVASLVFARSEFSAAACWFGALAGLLAFGAMALLIKSLKRGHATVNVVVFRLNFVLTATVSLLVFKDEAVTWQKIAGLAAAVVAVGVFFVGVSRSGGTEGRALGYAAGGMVVAAAFQLTLAWAAKSGVRPAAFLLVQSLVFMAPATVYAWWDQRMRLPRPVIKYAALNGVLMAAGTLATLASVVEGQASVCFPITQLSFVVTAVLAVAFLHERMTLSKAVGCLLAIGAIVLLGV